MSVICGDCGESWATDHACAVQAAKPLSQLDIVVAEMLKDQIRAIRFAAIRARVELRRGAIQ